MLNEVSPGGCCCTVLPQEGHDLIVSMLGMMYEVMKPEGVKQYFSTGDSPGWPALGWSAQVVPEREGEKERGCCAWVLPSSNSNQTFPVALNMKQTMFNTKHTAVPFVPAAPVLHATHKHQLQRGCL